MAELNCVCRDNVCFAPHQKREKAPLHESHEKALPVPSLTNEARFLTLRSMPASWPLTSIHLGLSCIGSEDQSSNSLHLREKLPLREDDIALRALSIE